MRTLHLLDRSDTSKSPKITVADPGELLLDLLHDLASDVESVVGLRMSDVLA